jgi:hypothetical protein
MEIEFRNIQSRDNPLSRIQAGDDIKVNNKEMVSTASHQRNLQGMIVSIEASKETIFSPQK